MTCLTLPSTGKMAFEPPMRPMRLMRLMRLMRSPRAAPDASDPLFTPPGASSNTYALAAAPGRSGQSHLDGPLAFALNAYCSSGLAALRLAANVGDPAFRVRSPGGGGGSVMAVED